MVANELFLGGVSEPSTANGTVERARDIEPFTVGLERNDIAIDEIAVLWVPS